MENMVQIYNSTYKNCEFYMKRGNEKALLNEIGVLRGICCCLESIVGTENLSYIIDFPRFSEMISKQEALKAN